MKRSTTRKTQAPRNRVSVREIACRTSWPCASALCKRFVAPDTCALLYRHSLQVLQGQALDLGPYLHCGLCTGSDDEEEAAAAADGKLADVEDADDDGSDQSTAEHHNGIVPAAATLQKQGS